MIRPRMRCGPAVSIQALDVRRRNARYHCCSRHSFFRDELEKSAAPHLVRVLFHNPPAVG
jgi:hypothetical protein